eukprot:TRINITY_DN83340_c0_g1_i1.p1 TRINITY_DN83340_c0_g1~~TRINITY_DN83340_c0_g1_i1.p1  ORF type:complete len:322 (+),score=63.38 TRINITY_DN83340_c0_g1_i1:54-968(+)
MPVEDGPSTALAHQDAPESKRRRCDNQKLVMDVGANFGQSSERYLAAGHRVVAVEPNPRAAEAIRQRLGEQLTSGELKLEEKAVWLRTPSARVTLYVNEEDSEWSSVLQSCGERYDTQAREVEVETTSLEELFRSHGTPWYLKLDTEGADGIILQQLAGLTKPAYLSFELNSLSYLDEACGLGYHSFKVVAQGGHKAEHLRDEQGRPLTHAGDFGEAAIDVTRGVDGWKTRGEVLDDCRRLCLVHNAELDVQRFAAGPPRYVDRDFATLRACFPVESKNDEEWYDIHCRHCSVLDVRPETRVET